MYAVVTTGGRQIKVAEGDVVRVEKLNALVGDMVELGRVCLLATDGELVVDPGRLSGAKVVCQVTAQGRRKKVRVFKKKRRKNYMRTAGHRQRYTELKVEKIDLSMLKLEPKKTKVQPEPESEPKPKTEAEDSAEAAAQAAPEAKPKAKAAPKRKAATKVKAAAKRPKAKPKAKSTAKARPKAKTKPKPKGKK